MSAYEINVKVDPAPYRAETPWYVNVTATCTSDAYDDSAVAAAALNAAKTLGYLAFIWLDQSENVVCWLNGPNIPLPGRSLRVNCYVETEEKAKDYAEFAKARLAEIASPSAWATAVETEQARLQKEADDEEREYADRLKREAADAEEQDIQAAMTKIRDERIKAKAEERLKYSMTMTTDAPMAEAGCEGEVDLIGLAKAEERLRHSMTMTAGAPMAEAGCEGEVDLIGLVWDEAHDMHEEFGEELVADVEAARELALIEDSEWEDMETQSIEFDRKAREYATAIEAVEHKFDTYSFSIAANMTMKSLGMGYRDAALLVAKWAEEWPSPWIHDVKAFVDACLKKV